MKMRNVRNVRNLITVLALLLALSSCSKYQKLLKSDDEDLKYNAAVDYYNAKDYTRAAELFSDVISKQKGSEKMEPSYFMRSMCYFYQKDYMTAGNYFGMYIKRFPTSDKCETAQYNKAYCLYEQSPNPELDQTTTREAIQEFQLFANVYPNSSHITDVNTYLDVLKDKLVEKSYLSAKLYFDLGDYRGNNYRAAVITAQNSLKEFPDTKYREDLSYLIVRAKYEQAINSVPDKMLDRYTQTVDEYYSFMNEFPSSKYKKEVNTMYNNSLKHLATLEKKQHAKLPTETNVSTQEEIRNINSK